VFLGEPRKVQISKNIAQQYEALETILFQNASSLARPAGLRPQMQVREDHRVVHVPIHDPLVPADCYARMNIASKFVQVITKDQEGAPSFWGRGRVGTLIYPDVSLEHTSTFMPSRSLLIRISQLQHKILPPMWPRNLQPDG
jgi:hypothetical protein